MTSRANMRRLTHVDDTIAARPVSPRVARAAFGRFRATGELPDDDRLARTVILRVLRGYEVLDGDDPRFDPPEVLALRQQIPPRAPDEVMNSLLAEAVSPHALVRHSARHVLCLFAQHGLDVTGTPFHGRDIDLPTHGSVAVHLLGLHKQLLRRPFQRETLRLQRRLEALCERLDASPGTLAEACRAAEKFRRTGGLPDDELVFDTVLALGEVSTLTQHALGIDVSQEMACFDAIAGARTDDERLAGIERLQEMAVAGRLCS